MSTRILIRTMSNERADIRSVDVIDAFRTTLVGFVDSGRAALMEAESDLEKTILWLERDRVPHWNRLIRRQQELLTRAKSELYRKQMQSSAKEARVGDSDERMNLQRAERHLQEARGRLDATKSWIRRLERERTLYKAAVSPFATSVDHELPHAIALLRKMSEDLEAYTSMPAPDLARLLAVDDQDATSTRRAPEPDPDPANPTDSEDDEDADSGPRGIPA